jgi:hypothetical protein
MGADPALAAMQAGDVRAGAAAVKPSGADALVCCASRQLLASGRAGIAIALPRGRTGLPAVLGIYLTMHRWQNPNLCGSVLVATAHGDVSQGLSELTVRGMPELHAARLISRPRPGGDTVLLDGTVRPAERHACMRPLDRGAPHGLSQRDGLLLFVRPGSIPAPPASRVFCCGVVDTAGCSRPAPGHAADLDGADSWSAAHRALSDTGTPTVWLGELGDEQFEAFCAARGFPVVRLTWPLLERLAERAPFGRGEPPLSASGLCARALDRPPLQCRLVHDSERDEHARSAYMLLGKMRREARGGPMPAPVKAAYRYLNVTSRLASPLSDYEAAAAVGSPVFNHPVRSLLEREIRQADSSKFRGRWKEAYRRHWDSLVGELRAVARLSEEEPMKLLALFDEVAVAQKVGRQLIVCVQTETERRALHHTLEALEATANVTVTTYADRARAGDGAARRRVVLLAPPPPWQAPLLLSGEGGRVVALCYSHEAPKLRQAVAGVEDRYDDDRANSAALDRLRTNNVVAAGNGWEPPATQHVVQLAAFGDDDNEPARDHEDDDNGGAEIPEERDEQLWRQLVDLWGDDIEQPDRSAPPLGFGAAPYVYSGLARVVRFANAPPVAFCDDRLVDVIADASGSSEIASKPPSLLVAGDHIAFLPGVEHHSLRDALMAAWDETLQTARQMCEPLWRAAITEAVRGHGLDGVAALCGRHESTVRTWFDGRNAPQQVEDFEVVLELSGIKAAWEARAAIWRLLEKTRGMHRFIGRLLNGAVAEALSGTGDQPNIRELERLTKTPVGDLLDVAEDLTVVSVGPPVRTAIADCGRYLPYDHPLLTEGSSS